MTNDLISRSALLANGIKVRCGLNDNGMIFVPMADVRKSIEEAPAVDAVAVVRCKDCAWCKKPFPEYFPQMLECMRFDMEVAADEFCSRSERRADE